MSSTIGRRAGIALSAAAILAVRDAGAQGGGGNAPAGGPAHLITYLEVAPAAVEETLVALRAHAASSRADAACLRLDLLRRIDRPHHFALTERWRDAAALAAHVASPRLAAFRATIGPALIAPYDERPHSSLSIGEPAEAAGAIFTVTHVDIVPPQRDVGAAAVAGLAMASRGTPGNLRFDALIQDSRPNHFTLVEAWRDEAALLAHAAAAPTRGFRGGLLPMSGSLFDERLYRQLT
ncbi:putative quinol monooxygenase [Roseomonas sp. F4]